MLEMACAEVISVLPLCKLLPGVLREWKSFCKFILDTPFTDKAELKRLRCKKCLQDRAYNLVLWDTIKQVQLADADLRTQFT